MYFSAVVGKPAKDVESRLLENMPRWGKVRVVGGDSICCTWTAENHSEKGQNMSFIRVSLPFVVFIVGNPSLIYRTV
jgi:hypothetical protein